MSAEGVADERCRAGSAVILGAVWSCDPLECRAAAAGGLCFGVLALTEADADGVGVETAGGGAGGVAVLVAGGDVGVAIDGFEVAPDPDVPPWTVVDVVPALTLGIVSALATPAAEIDAAAAKPVASAAKRRRI